MNKLNKLVLTQIDNKTICSYLEDSKLVELRVDNKSTSQIVGNIYIGKVKNILTNIQAAFIDIGINQNCYYSLVENKSPLFVNPKKDTLLKVGDEIIVQVMKEAIKTKGPVVTSNFHLMGKYVILTVGKSYIGISSKIEEDLERERLKDIITPYLSENYGFIIRTNSQSIDGAHIVQEVNNLVARYHMIHKTSQFATCFQCIERSPSNIITTIRDYHLKKLDEIIVEDRDIYDEIKGYLTAHEPNHVYKLRHYQDSLLPLHKLYSIETGIMQALKPKIWLKSGASIIIQPTEAFVAIDVNTGKFIGKKNLEETFLKINLEAAQEICRQLRLRNLSGIIVIDFIDMAQQTYKNQLLNTLASLLHQDPVKATLVGMSKLNLVEITRKKVRKPLHEEFARPCTNCNGTGLVSR